MNLPQQQPQSATAPKTGANSQRNARRRARRNRAAAANNVSFAGDSTVHMHQRQGRQLGKVVTTAAPVARNYTQYSRLGEEHMSIGNVDSMVEVAFSVTVSSQGNFAVQNTDENVPGLTDTFGKNVIHPNLLAIAKTLSTINRQYRFDKMRIIWKPSCPTTVSGLIHICFVTNAEEPAPKTLSEMTSQAHAVSGSIWEEQSLLIADTNMNRVSMHELRDYVRDSTRHLKEKRWCRLGNGQAPGNTIAGYFTVATSGTNLKEDESGVVNPYTYGQIMIEWGSTFFSPHVENADVNGQSYQYSVRQDADGNLVSEQLLGCAIPQQVAPLGRRGNVQSSLVEEAGLDAPVVTIGQHEQGYMVTLDAVTDEAPDGTPTLQLTSVGEGGVTPIVADMTGCLYTKTTEGRAITATYLLTEKTVTAMAQTLGLSVELGSFWSKFKGAMCSAFKFATKVANAIITIAPVVADLLKYHEQRWSELHPSNINLLRKYYSTRTPLRHQIVAATPIERMISRVQGHAPAHRFNREMEVRDRDHPRDPDMKPRETPGRGDSQTSRHTNY